MQVSFLHGRVGSFFLAVMFGLAACGADASVQRIFLVSYGDTLYRVRGTSIEVFPNMPGASIIGMTVIPEGASVSGASAGDVLAVEGAGGSLIWRIANAVAGTPSSVLLGSFPAELSRGDITFAHERLFAIQAAVIHEHSTTDFLLVDTIDLERPNASTGGLTFDGSQNWYIANQNSNRIIRLADPPSAESWEPIGDAGVVFGNNDLEFHNGVLWAALESGGRLVVGTIDLDTGVFVQVLDVAPIPVSRGIGLAIVDVCGADLNHDGALDFFDVLSFLSLYTDGNLIADFTEDGSLDFFDLQAFLIAYSEGCI